MANNFQKAVTLIPLSLLSAAWTINLAGLDFSTPKVEAAIENSPSVVAVPDEAFDVPLSYSSKDTFARSYNVEWENEGTEAIPAVALAAYQRAETVINKADSRCHLEWELLAAVAKVESNHGSYAGNRLDPSGFARPGVYGLSLNGDGGRPEVSDTDAGQYDNDQVWDRPVGPFQFLPSLWSSIGVDADGDHQRNPQSIHDSALASAVYFCAGKENLSKSHDRKAALARYNENEDYGELVLKIYEKYLNGAYRPSTLPLSTVPNLYNNGSRTPEYMLPPLAPDKPKQQRPKDRPTKPKPSDPAPPPVEECGVKCEKDDPKPPPENKPKDLEEKAKETKDKIEKDLKELYTKAEAINECGKHLSPALSGILKGLGSLNLEAILKALASPLLGGSPKAAKDFSDCVTSLEQTKKP